MSKLDRVAITLLATSGNAAGAAFEGEHGWPGWLVLGAFLLCQVFIVVRLWDLDKHLTSLP